MLVSLGIWRTAIGEIVEHARCTVGNGRFTHRQEMGTQPTNHDLEHIDEDHAQSKTDHREHDTRKHPTNKEEGEGELKDRLSLRSIKISTRIQPVSTLF